jgi:hypothetical protein
VLRPLVPAAPVEEDPTQDDLDQRVTVIERGGARSMLERALLLLLPALPQLTAPLVEVGE